MPQDDLMERNRPVGSASRPRRQLGVQFGQEVDGPRAGGWDFITNSIRLRPTLRPNRLPRTGRFPIPDSLSGMLRLFSRALHHFPHTHHPKPQPLLLGTPLKNKRKITLPLDAFPSRNPKDSDQGMSTISRTPRSLCPWQNSRRRSL